MCSGGEGPPGRISFPRTVPVNPAHIRLAAGLAVSFSLLAPRHISAQQQSSSTVPYTPAVGRCLTPEQRKVNDNYNSLERPTRPGDEMPFWDPEYLVGT